MKNLIKKLGEYRVFSGQIEITNSYRRKGGYFGYQTEVLKGYFAIDGKGSHYKVCVNVRGMYLYLLFTSRKQNYKTSLKEVAHSTVLRAMRKEYNEYIVKKEAEILEA